MSEQDRIEQALTFDTGCEPSAQEIIDALNRAGFQITPQTGEAEPPILCRHEPYQGYCGHCGIPFRDGKPYYRTAPPSPVGPTAGDILISRDAAMTVLARWVYDEHWMKASDDMLAVAVQPSPVAPVWQPIETAPHCVSSSPGDNGRRPVIVCRWPASTPSIFPRAIARLTTTGWISGRQGNPLWFEPTHWMHLPGPPDSPGTTGGS